MLSHFLTIKFVRITIIIMNGFAHTIRKFKKTKREKKPTVIVTTELLKRLEEWKNSSAVLTLIKFGERLVVRLIKSVLIGGLRRTGSGSDWCLDQ